MLWTKLNKSLLFIKTKVKMIINFKKPPFCLETRENPTLLSNPCFTEELISAVTKFLQYHNSKNLAYQNLWDEATAIPVAKP